MTIIIITKMERFILLAIFLGAIQTHELFFTEQPLMELVKNYTLPNGLCQPMFGYQLFDFIKLDHAMGLDEDYELESMRNGDNLL